MFQASETGRFLFIEFVEIAEMCKNIPSESKTWLFAGYLSRVFYLPPLEHELFIKEAYVRKMKDKGYTILAWTVNDTERMLELVGWGVDGIITDVPDEALVALQDAGHIASE